jgi:hypothetical protein
MLVSPNLAVTFVFATDEAWYFCTGMSAITSHTISFEMLSIAKDLERRARSLDPSAALRPLELMRN